MFVPDYFYVLDFAELKKDVALLSSLDVAYHYNTHGDQLIDLDLRSAVLKAVDKIISGEVEPGEIEFLGTTQTLYVVDDRRFLYMPDMLMY